MPVRAIDCHAHVMRRDLPLASERHSAPKRDVSVEEFLGVLDAHGISHGVLTAPSFYGTDNQLLLARRSPRIPTACAARPSSRRISRRRRWRSWRGAAIVGMRLNWFGAMRCRT